ncbi:uncharacterized protein LOC114176895 isoform X2 [Vigna unguiculata]|uniref:uncharacterized protein LOC114176895 isoform X2 n=1 Tax=Vigna unguiculata TaxID=3917 RepID=UPI0010163966|nr:uncharacterized protein LOC114176895 isoform X2 [Vigna unguiculata]
MEPKNDFVRWTFEFILQNVPDTEINGNMLKNAVRIAAGFSVLDSRLRKAILLKTLRYHLCTHSITEPLLETLEFLEELFHCEASPVTATMTAAYCAVAVECTTKYLKLNPHHHNPLYLDAVNRIWRVRIALMNSSGERRALLSGELEQWRKDIETSLLDSEVMERLASIDTKRDAMVKLKAFLGEACPDLDPSSHADTKRDAMVKLKAVLDEACTDLDPSSHADTKRDAMVKLKAVLDEACTDLDPSSHAGHI